MKASTGIAKECSRVITNCGEKTRREIQADVKATIFMICEFASSQKRHCCIDSVLIIERCSLLRGPCNF